MHLFNKPVSDHDIMFNRISSMLDAISNRAHPLKASHCDLEIWSYSCEIYLPSYFLVFVAIFSGKMVPFQKYLYKRYFRTSAGEIDGIGAR